MIMKTKMLMALLAASVVLVISLSCKGNQPQDKSSDEQVLSVLKSFYTSYIAENVKMPPNGPKIISIKEKYCTTSLLDKINSQELDYDPFLKAQDCNAEWLNTLTIKADSTKKGLYNVSYIDNNTQVTVKLVVVRDKESYKISSVW